MADNVAVTAGSGTNIATDDVSSVHYPKMKIALGADGAIDTLVDSGQQTMANSVPVVLASDQAAIPVSQSGTWNVTNVSGTVSLPTGAATAAKQPVIGTAGTASTDVMTVQGIASMTALKVDGSAVTQPVSGTVTANAGTGTMAVSLASVPSHAVTNAGTFAVQVTSLPASTNTIEVVGDAAHDAAVAGNPILQGAEARDTLGTAVTSGDAVRVVANRYGHLLTTTQPPSHASSNGTPIAATTTSAIAAPSAGSHLRIMRVHLSNGGSTASWVSLRDGAAGTQYYRTYLPQNGVLSLNLNQSGPLDLTSATRLDIVMSAAGSVEYTIDYLTVAD